MVGWLSCGHFLILRDPTNLSPGSCYAYEPQCGYSWFLTI